jgi:KipI family sensor histidine kinase inhibitor
MAASAGLAITLAANRIALTNRRIMRNSEKGLHPMGNRVIGQPDAVPAWRWVSERGMRLATGGDTLARHAALSSARFAEIEDLIPADGSLLLVLRRGAAVSAELQAALAAPLPPSSASAGRRHEIATEYGGAAGPDLPALAEQAGLGLLDYIDCHASVDYTVAFIGFQPGFPYLRGLPPALHAARRASPRLRVPAGSVAIGGTYTGIYPAEGPGGWHLIGRTAALLFDPQRAEPALLQPGDRVRFVPA